MKFVCVLLLGTLSMAAMAGQHLSCNSDRPIRLGKISITAYLGGTVVEGELTRLISYGGLSFDTSMSRASYTTFTSPDVDGCVTSITLPADFTLQSRFQGEVDVTCGGVARDPVAVNCTL
jgi:hypothetical protein